MATQIRVVLSSEVKPIADEIKQVTCCGSTSEVISLILSRYGRHFINWWLTNPHQAESVSSGNLLNDFAIPQPDVDLSSPIEL
ncbi:hypothetical protein NDI44_27055 [Trichocoleus sp. DQ-A3]|uniref:hypothetical protein n=1 Tax=Cyanophyceae TaxID=3028117 RepID=UPI0016886CD3|nr:hypothetical protein [Coleofasciculus sp. FACHB-125]MBD1903784.1 hypothetical protein [Coleofasciculus sp. FACHB-125]